ncbi:C25 family cysteine peptidase [Spirosoma telluris]
MISYAGHGSSNTLDFNFGYCSSPTSNFHNKGKYPILFFNGCSINNIFYKYDPLSTDWLITPDKGAIAVLAGSFWSYPASTQQYVYSLYQKLFADSTSLTGTLGKIQQLVNQDLSSQSSDLTLRSDMQQIILQGDPALHIFPLSKPDYAVRSLFVQARKAGTVIQNDDSLTVNLILANVGKYITGQAVSIELKKIYSTNETVSQHVVIHPGSFRDTLSFPVKKELSVKRIELTVDSDSKIDELNETNNQIGIDLADWAEIQKNSVYPVNALPDQLNPILSVTIDNRVIKNGDYVSANPVIHIGLTDENQLPIDNLATIQAYLKQCDACPFITLKPQSGSVVSSVSLLATYQLTQLPTGTYELLATGRDASGNASGNAYAITFNVADATTPIEWKVYPNPSSEVAQISFTVVGKVAPKSARLLIFSSIGELVDSYLLTPFVGENIVYWEKLRGLPAGLYQASLQAIWEDGRQETVSGRIVKR